MGSILSVAIVVGSVILSAVSLVAAVWTIRDTNKRFSKKHT